MKRIVKRLAIGVSSIVGLAVIVVYGVSEYRLRQTFDIPATPIPISVGMASLARGQHVYATRGCTGCHGEGMKGKVFFDEPYVARMVAPNVPKVIRGYTDAELARVLRHGVRPNGRGVAVMPSSMFFALDDEDLGSLIAFLRRLPVAPDSLPPTDIRILARVGLVTGQYKLEPMNITHDAPRPPKGPDAAALGLYVARTSCTECHGMKLEGSQDTPALSVVAAYSAEQFAKLMREGVPKDGRKLGLMAETAKHRFAYFTDEEVNGLYTYLSQSAPAVAGQ